MTQLLLHLFVKNYQDTGDPEVRGQYGRLAGLAGIAVNVLLCAGKFLAGLLSGSVAILADAVNNLSDAASSVVTLLARRYYEAAKKYLDSSQIAQIHAQLGF